MKESRHPCSRNEQQLHAAIIAHPGSVTQRMKASRQLDSFATSRPRHPHSRKSRASRTPSSWDHRPLVLALETYIAQNWSGVYTLHEAMTTQALISRVTLQAHLHPGGVVGLEHMSRDIIGLLHMSGEIYSQPPTALKPKKP